MLSITALANISIKSITVKSIPNRYGSIPKKTYSVIVSVKASIRKFITGSPPTI